MHKHFVFISQHLEHKRTFYRELLSVEFLYENTRTPLCGGLERQQSEGKPAACPASMEFSWHPRLHQQQHVHLLKEGQPALRPLLQVKTDKYEQVKGKTTLAGSWSTCCAEQLRESGLFGLEERQVWRHSIQPVCLGKWCITVKCEKMGDSKYIHNR